MDGITVVLCSWKSFPMLYTCVESLRANSLENTNIKVVLNEYNRDSVNYLSDINIDFVACKDNRGTVAVDLLTPLLDSEYVVSINDDQIVNKGWDADLLNIYTDHYPCVPSVKCVEPEFTNNPMVIADNVGHILEILTRIKFEENCLNDKYKTHNLYGFNHPNLVRVSDWKKVGGYSCGLPYNFFGLGGYNNDDYFNYKLWKLYDEQLKFIVSGNSWVFHQVSFSGKRLPPEIKNYDSHAKFVELTGMTTKQFRDKLNWGQAV